MRRALLVALMLLPGAVRAQGLLDGMGGAWAVGSTANCARSPYELSVGVRDGIPVLSFRDRAGRVNDERVDSQWNGGVTTTTLLSPDVPRGTRWNYAATGDGAFMVRNLSNGRQFTIVRCSEIAPMPAAEQSCRAEVGARRASELVNQCIAVSEMTHPPCNSANPCSMMTAEITRACGERREDRLRYPTIPLPAFCARY